MCFSVFVRVPSNNHDVDQYKLAAKTTVLVQTICMIERIDLAMNSDHTRERDLAQNPKPSPRRQSYLLRCWETRSQHPDHSSSWRFSLQDSQTGEQQHFADLKSLLAFLQGTFDDAEHRQF